MFFVLFSFVISTADDVNNACKGLNLKPYSDEVESHLFSTAGEQFCIYIKQESTIVFINDAAFAIEGVGYDGSYSGPHNGFNVYASTMKYTLITALTNSAYYFMYFVAPYGLQQSGALQRREVFVTKRNFEATFGSEKASGSNPGQNTILYFVTRNSYNIEIEPKGFDGYVNYNAFDNTKKKHVGMLRESKTFNAIYYAEFQPLFDAGDSVAFGAHIKASTPDDEQYYSFPEKVFLRQNNTIYLTADENYEIPAIDIPEKEDDGLNAGEIAGISIACVVVVAAVVFCVVWFVVLKKSCCCSKDQ